MPQFVAKEVAEPLSSVIGRILGYCDRDTKTNPLRITDASDRLTKRPGIVMGAETAIDRSIYFVMQPYRAGDGSSQELWPIIGVIEETGPNTTRVSINRSCRHDESTSRGYGSLQQCLGIDF